MFLITGYFNRVEKQIAYPQHQFGRPQKRTCSLPLLVFMKTTMKIIVLCFTIWLVNINNLGSVVLNMLATSKSCGNTCFFDQHYQQSKINSQVSVLMIEYLVAVTFELWML